MQNKVNKLKYILLVLILSIILPINVLAKDKINLEVSKTDLKAGDEVTVSINVDENTDLYALTASLNYDKNVFEEIDETNFLVLDENILTSYNANRSKFGIINKTGSIKGELFKIELKVKDDANVGNTNIVLTNITSSNGKEKETYEKSSVNLLVTRDATPYEEISKNEVFDANDTPEKVTKTFSTMPLILGISLGLILILAYVLYLYFNKDLKNKKKMVIGISTGALVLVLSLTYSFSLNNSKQDINKDGVKDYDDTKEIIDYLIDITGTPDETSNDSSNKKSNNLFNLDFNNDGKVDINDAGGSASNVLEKVKYKVKLTEKETDYYFPKGKITLEFYAEIEPNEPITEVKIDGTYYKALKVGDYYAVSLDIKEYGVHDFKITNLKLRNTKEVKAKLTIKKEILKDVPYVNDFNVNEEENSLTFKLVDYDKAFLSGVAKVYDGDTLITSAPVSNSTTVKADFEKDKIYNILILGNYNLDSDPNNNKNIYQEEEMFSHSFMVSGNYNFVLNNVSITDAINKNEKPKLTFTSTNTRGAKVEKVKLTIDNVSKDYSITKTSLNNYEIELDNIKIGKHTVIIEDVTLSTLKTFKNKEDFKALDLTYEVLKDAPKVSKIELKEGEREYPEAEEDKRIKKGVEVNFSVDDKDNAISNITVALIDSTNKIADKKELSKEEYKKYLENPEPIFLKYADKNGSNNNYGYFKVEILADYTLGDKHNYTDKNIGEETIIPNSGVVIENVKFVKLARNWLGNIYTIEKGEEGKYATKGENEYALEFDVRTTGIDSYTRLSSITINGLNYTLNGGATAIPDPDDPDNTKKKFQYVSYTSLKVPNEAGVVDLVLNRVQFEVNGYYAKQNDYYTVPEKTVKFEVLKDIPTIKNLEIKNEDREKKEVTFNFDVVSEKGAFLEGLVTLGDNEIKITKDNLEKKEVTFKNIELDTLYDLTFKATYDLASGELETSNKNLNRKENATIYTIKYGMYDDSLYKDIKIENARAVSQRGTNYFEKTEKIALEFNIEGIPYDLKPERVVIKDKVYNILEENDKYKLELEGFSNYGIKDIVITNVILNNGKNVKLTESSIVKAIVLKDFPVIENYRYEITDNEIKIDFSNRDYDISLDGKLNVSIKDEDGNTVYSGHDTSIKLDRNNEIVRYYLKVIGSYDRDTDIRENSDNYHKNVILLDEIISLDKNNIELKDISYITLYKTENDKTLEITSISHEELAKNKDEYFVLVKMENMPDVYAKIKNVIEEDNKLYLALDYEYLTKEDKVKTNDIRVLYGVIKDGRALNETNPVEEFEKLLNKIRDNQDITLTHDYNMNEIKVDTTYYFETYKGKLDGKGHKLYNLSKQLFNKLEDGAIIENLTLENVNVSGNLRGILADSATNTKIHNVHIYNAIINANNSTLGTGIMFGDTRTNLEITNSSIVNSSVSGGKRTGGFIGQAYNKTTIKDSYINESSVSGNLDAIGGIVGEVSSANNVTFSNCYSKVTMNAGNGTAKAGILGYTNNRGATSLNDSLSLSLGTNGKRVHGNGIKANNVYELKESNMGSNKDQSIQEIEKENINYNFFKNQLHWDEAIWNLKDASYEVPPTLQGETFSKDNFLELETGYDDTKLGLYNNLMKLMPFYSYEKIIKLSKEVKDENLINNEIVNIVPVDKNGKLVTYLTSNNYKKISKIKIIYKDRQKAEYNVTYDKTYDMVASYRIKDLKLDYNYNHYIINADSQVVINLTNYLKKLNYTDNLDILTSTTDSRIYKDFYNEKTSKELKEFVLKFLSNSNFTNTSNDSRINNYLEREVKKDKKIEKVLYMYNYFKRFYSLDIDGIDISDFMLFNLDGFNETLTPLKIAELYLQDGNNFSTGNTNKKYVSVLSNYTKLSNISKLLEYLVLGLSNHDMASWTRSQFKGYLVEIPVKGHQEIQYTLWDHFSNPDKGKDDTSYQVYDYILPILTLPKNAAYIISSPVQFVIGAERSYIKNPDNQDEQKTLQRRIGSYVTRMSDYFNTAYMLLEDKDVFNNIHTYHLDKRFAYDDNGMMVYQQQLVTEEPFHKNFNEVVGRWATSDGNAAVAWGDRIEWSAEGLLDGNLIPEDGTVYEYTYHTWSHESAHNIDARLFLRDNGRRFDAGGEDYADSNLMQSFGENDIVMNLSVRFPKNTRIGSSYTPDRINSKAKIFDYYNKVFKTIYVMDFIEAQAFLQLSAEDQADVAVQISYPNEFKYDDLPEPELAEYRKYQTTAFNQVGADNFKNMDLKNIADLYDNKIMIYPGVYKLATRGSNSYGGEGISHVHWYQPNNPYGRPDSYSLKWIAYEMLGYKGYDEGYIEYYSNINSVKKVIYTDFEKKTKSTVDYKTDTMALKTITGYEDFRTYKLARFNEVEKNLKYLNKAINVKDYVQKFYDALIEDGEYAKTRLNELFKNGEQKCLNDYYCRIDVQSARSFAKSSNLRREIYYTLKELTNDFTSDIYSKTEEQDVSNLKVTKTEK